MSLEPALYAMRMLVMVLAAYHLWWTAPAVMAAARGDWGRRIAYRCALFFLIAGSFAFQIFALLGTPNTATRIMSHVILSVGLCVCFSVKRLSAHYGKFDKLFANLDAALAIVDLWKVAPGAATKIADDCRRLTAEAIVRRD